MTAPKSKSAPSGKRRWLRFSLRTLFVIVTLAAIGLGIWTQHMRWHVARLADPDTAEAAFDKIIELHAATLPSDVRENVMFRRKVLREQNTRRFNAWPQRPGSFLPGYIWVHEEATLYAVSPLGETNLAGIVLHGHPEILWNGTLRDGCPGIVVFNNDLGPQGHDGYLIAVSTRRVPSDDAEMPVVRLLIRVEHPDVTAELLSDTPSPTIALRSADGTTTEEFLFPHGAFAERMDEKAKTSTPWKLQMRW